MPILVTNSKYLYFSNYKALNSNIKLLKGDFLSDSEFIKIPEIVLNTRAANELFGSDDIIGEIVTINDTRFKIIGIVNTKDKDTMTGFISINTLPSSIEAQIQITKLYINEEKVIDIYKLIEKLGLTSKDVSVEKLK